MTDPALPRWLEAALACPECGGELAARAGGLSCADCGRSFSHDDGIWRLEPSQQRPPPPLYEDPDHQRLTAVLDEIHEEYYGASTTSRFEDWLKQDLMGLVVDRTPPLVDLGCGGGAGFDALGDPTQVLGIDLDLRLLRQAHQREPRATLVSCDITRAPFKEGSFRTMFCIGVLEHVFYLEAFLEGIDRLLHPDGYLYVAIPTEGGLGWTAARTLVTAPRFSRSHGFDYNRAMAVEHCNTVFTIDNELRKFFLVDASRRFPLRFGGNHLNLAVCYRLRRRSRS